MKQFAGMMNFVLGALITVILFTQFSFKTETAETKWIAPPYPQKLSFAGEEAPLERWDIKEKFEKELLKNYYSQGNIIYLIKLAKRNFPVISARLKANGVPDDFKYLCIAESNMQSWAISSSNAVGYWQFLKGTAPGYGLETSKQVDERMHLERSTDAACKYLKQAYARFGSWTAAAASYNCGMGGYNSRATAQKTKNYYDLFLPEETNKYIFRILSFKYLMENAEEMGFIVKDEEMYEPVPYRVVIVKTIIPDLTVFALNNGTNYKTLKLLNPWLQGYSLNASSSKTYALHLPANDQK